MSKETNKTEQAGIETYLPLFHGFYGSVWDDHDFYGEAEHFNLPEKFPFYEYVNYTEYYRDLSIRFCEIVEREGDKYIESVKYDGLYSPKYYNFTNDSINCTIIPKPEAIAEAIYQNREKFEQYLKDHLKSRDGFISFHSYLFEEWEEETNKFTEYTKNSFQLGFLLNFILEEIEGLNEQDVLYYGSDDIHVSAYYTDEFYQVVDSLQGLTEEYADLVNQDLVRGWNDVDEIKGLGEKVNEIVQFVKDNYNKLEVKELTAEKYGNDEQVDMFLYLNAIIERAFKQVEQNNLKIEFQD